MTRDLGALRRAYAARGLEIADLAGDPFTQFGRWLDDVVRHELDEPNAVVVATADADGRPSCRTVLLKAFDPSGFVFFTNYRSRKGRELAANPTASLLFPWHPLMRQVEVVGDVEQVPEAEAEAYFATRPRGSQLGAWASEQSAVIPDRAVLERRYAELDETHGETVPRPEHWGGYRVRPATVEFWQGRPDRLHDRLRYRRAGERWVIERLSP